jgi:predicted HTH transcriptional regulator
MTLESIRFYNHESRNPLIAQFLNRLGFMKEFGTGIPNMIRLMRSHNGTEPEFAIEGEKFVVRLFANGIQKQA